MLKDITLGQFFPGDSVIHKIDARFKIMLIMAYIITLFIINNFWGYLIIGVFTFSIIILTKIPFKFIFKGLKPLLFIIVFTAIINMFFTPGRELFKLWFIKATYEGVYLALFMIARLFFLICGTSLLTLTTSPIMLTDGIERLLKPFKRIGVPAHELAMMMTIALRFIPTLLEETDKIMKAQSSRGADLESGSLIDRAKAMIPILVPLFISAFRRADELAIAMECRCYNGGDNRTRLRQLKSDKRDFIAVGIMVCLTVVLVFSRLI